MHGTDTFTLLQGDNLFHLLGSRFLPDGAAYMLAAATVMVPTVWLPNLKALSYLGVFGITATVTVATTVSCSFPNRRISIVSHPVCNSHNTYGHAI